MATPSSSPKDLADLQALSSTQIVEKMILHLTPSKSSTPDLEQDVQHLKTFMEHILRKKEEEVKEECSKQLERNLQEFKEQQTRIQSLEGELSQLKKAEIQNKHNIYMNINEKPDTDYNSKDIVNAHQFCKGIYDYEILSTLVEASGNINDNDNILNNLKDVSKMTARNLIKVSKICEDTERNEQMTNLQSNVLKTMLKGSEEMKRRACWAYKTLILQRARLTEAKKTFKEEIKERNLNEDRPEDKAQFLTPPTFNGTTTALKPHFYEYWDQLTEYAKATDISTEARPMLVRSQMEGEAKSRLDQKFGSKMAPTLKELKEFLKDEFGNEEQILQKIINCHKETGSLSLALDTTKIIDRGQSHLNLYDKAIQLEKVRPGLTTNSYSYLCALRKIVPADAIIHITRKSLNSTKETIEAFVDEIKTTIQTAKVLQERTNGEDINTEQETDDLDECSSNDEEEDWSEDPCPTYYTQLNPPSPLVREDHDRSCSLCYHSGTGTTGTSHKFSFKGNIEVDACPLLAPLDLIGKETLLDDIKFCKTCLYRKQHGECRSLPPELHHLLCGSSGCKVRWAICAKHKQDNLPKLERRKMDLASHGIKWTF